MGLPKIGLQAVLENSAGFNKAIDAVNKKVEESTKQMKNAAKSADPVSKALDKIGVSGDQLSKKLADLSGSSSGATQGIMQLLGAIGPAGIAIGIAVAGVAALAAGFLALGNRGAALVPLAESFDHLTASVGISSQALLVDLRKAANGTVSDFDLIKRANLALVGSTGEFGKQFGQKLPEVLAAARAAAKATGQDVDFLFQSLVSGIKRASPRLIDNTGIVLKLSEANQALADSLGKNVNQLTEEEKQIAVLNATVEAGATLIGSLGDAQESNAEKLARSQATITNILDSLAVSVQPVFGQILDGVNNFLANIQGIIPYVQILLNGIGKILGSVAGALGNIKFGDLAKRLFEGAAAAFGSFANAIISVANQLIFPAVIGIAKFIADFLIGFSPPKKGPLSVIDKGGENLMKAWLDGIAGVSLDPVEQVASEVSTLLGDVGKASLPAVNARLAELDKALLPFQNRLDIVKSQFDAIAEPAKAALDAIDRQMQAAQEALAGGDVNAANTIRQLDAARAAIQSQLDLQQQAVDKQQIQLGLATAAQAQERALLNIRKAQFAAVNKVATASQKVAGGAKEPKPAGGTAPTPAEAAAGVGGIATPAAGQGVLDLIGGQSAVNDAIAGIQDAFAGQIDTSQLDLFGENSTALQEQFDRIGSVDLGAKLGDKFKGLTDLFNPEVEGSPANSIKTFVETLTAGPDTPGSVASFFSNMGPNIQAATAGFGELIAAQFDPNTEGTPANLITNAVRTLTGDEATADSVASFFAQMPENVSNAASGLFDKLQTDVFAPVANFLTGTGEGTLSGVIDGVVGFFTELPSRVALALAGMGAAIYTALVIPVISSVNALIEAVENGIRGFVNGIATFIGGIADGLDGLNLGIDTSGLHNTVADLNSKAAGISFGRISTAIPAFLTPAVPGAATGGMFGSGLLKVGERGPELIAPADKIGVLPTGLTRALESLSSIMAAPPPMQVAGNTYNNQSSSSFTFNGVQSDNDARRRYNALRAGMR